MTPPASTSVAPARRQTGGTAVGFLFGVIAGLAVAAMVAITVTRAPLPFLDKNAQVNAPVLRSEGEALPDPNLALRPADSVGRAAEPAVAGSSSVPAPVVPGGAPVSASAPQATGNSIYLLQAGAFRSASDAESMRARLALMGQEGQIQRANVNNEVIFRVRIGPFMALDSMNTVRAELANNGIEASVVRQ